jgi:hypothetical protein
MLSQRRASPCPAPQRTATPRNAPQHVASQLNATLFFLIPLDALEAWLP